MGYVQPLDKGEHYLRLTFVGSHPLTQFYMPFQLIEKQMLDCSPGLVTAINERSLRLIGYSNLLRARGFEPSIYPYMTGSRVTALCDLEAVFKRWTQFAQVPLINPPPQVDLHLDHTLRIL